MERDVDGKRGSAREASQIDQLGGGDDQEFASIEDVGAAPSENPPVDDV